MTYDYKCDDCGHEWEEERRISDPAAHVSVCPKCRGDGRRTISSSFGKGFVLNGKGWAKDGYG